MPRFPGHDDSDVQDELDDRVDGAPINLGGSRMPLPIVTERPPALCDYGCVNYHEVKVLVEQMAPVDGTVADIRFATLRSCYPQTGTEFPLEQVVIDCNRFKTSEGAGHRDAMRFQYADALLAWRKESVEAEEALQKEMADMLDSPDPITEPGFVYLVRVFAPDGQTIIAEKKTTTDPTPSVVRDLVELANYASQSVSVQVRDASNDGFLSAFSFTV